MRYVSHKPDQAPLRLRIHDLAATRMRYGYFRIYILLRREGWFVNHKRVYRLYREEGLSLRLRRPRRNVSAANRERQPAAPAANEMWSMDFVSDALFDGRRLRGEGGILVSGSRNRWPSGKRILCSGRRGQGLILHLMMPTYFVQPGVVRRACATKAACIEPVSGETCRLLHRDAERAKGGCRAR